MSKKRRIKAEQDKIVKPEAFGSRFFCGENYFEVDSTLNYLVF